MVHTLTRRLVGALLLATVQVAQALTVFACEPEWAALIRAVWPPARVYAATTFLQDPHHIEARPALIAQARQADLAVCTGAALEAGWLPMLQQRSGNPKIQDGQPGMFYAADHVRLIDPYRGPDSPFAGDVHREGNPHLHADPHLLLTVSKALCERLDRLLPDARDGLAARCRDFQTDFAARISVWETRAAALRGQGVLAQHSSFGYLWRWLGMRQVADLEPRPGMPPTPTHLERIRSMARSEPVLAIVIASHQDARAGRWLASQEVAGAPLLVLPATVSDDRPEALTRWFEQLLNALVQAAR